MKVNNPFMGVMLLGVAKSVHYSFAIAMWTIDYDHVEECTR